MKRTRQDWRTFLFSDETRFALFIVMVGSRSTDVGMNVTLTCVLQRERFGGGGRMMVWAVIGYGYSTQLVVIDGNLNAQKYRDPVLAPHGAPLLQNHEIISVFQQDNVRPQNARDNIQFLQNNKIKVPIAPN